MILNCACFPTWTCSIPGHLLIFLLLVIFGGGGDGVGWDVGALSLSLLYTAPIWLVVLGLFSSNFYTSSGSLVIGF